MWGGGGETKGCKEHNLRGMCLKMSPPSRESTAEQEEPTPGGLRDLLVKEKKKKKCPRSRKLTTAGVSRLLTKAIETSERMNSKNKLNEKRVTRHLIYFVLACSEINRSLRKAAVLTIWRNEYWSNITILQYIVSSRLRLWQTTLVLITLRNNNISEISWGKCCGVNADGTQRSRENIRLTHSFFFFHFIASVLILNVINKLFGSSKPGGQHPHSTWTRSVGCCSSSAAWNDWSFIKDRPQPPSFWHKLSPFSDFFATTVTLVIICTSMGLKVKRHITSTSRHSSHDI